MHTGEESGAGIINTISARPPPDYTQEQLLDLRKCAEDFGIRLIVGYGPAPENNIASVDPKVREHALEFYRDLFRRMEKINSTLIGGGKRFIPAGPSTTVSRSIKRATWQEVLKNSPD